MSGGVSVSVDMDENFVQFLSKNVSLGKEVADVVRKHGAGMQQLAQSYAPVDTGFLKRHINLGFTMQGFVYTAVVTGDAEYDPYQEYGTRYQAGTPHLRPALYNTEDKFIADMNRLVRDNT